MYGVDDCIAQERGTLRRISGFSLRYTSEILWILAGLAIVWQSAPSNAHDPFTIGKNSRNEMVSSAMTLQEVLALRTEDLMALAGVVGTGLGLCHGEPCIKVFVAQKNEDIEEAVSQILKGYPYEIKESGKMRALPEQ